jgi:16S rRNA processing protein RimM
VPDRSIQLGVIGRPHGVRGLVRVTSHTAEPADLTAYGPLSDGDKRRFVLRWVSEGVAEVSEILSGALVKLADRNAAEKLTNTRLYVDRAAMPPPEEEDEYYLADLIGLSAVDAAGTPVGTVVVVHDYGAGTSLEIERAGGGAALILPFTRACVPVVDIAAGQVVVQLPDEIIVEPAAETAA